MPPKSKYAYMTIPRPGYNPIRVPAHITMHVAQMMQMTCDRFRVKRRQKRLESIVNIPSLYNEIQQDINELKETYNEKRKKTDKKERRALYNAYISEVQAERHKKADSEISEIERTYLATIETLEKADDKKIVDEIVKEMNNELIFKQQPYEAFCEEKNGKILFFIRFKHSQTPFDYNKNEKTLIGVVYTESERFLCHIGTDASGSCQAIYLNVMNKQDYVKNRYGGYTRRFIFRNLSEFDWKAIIEKSGLFLAPRHTESEVYVTDLQNKNEKTSEVLEGLVETHLRAAASSDSPFISFTYTYHPIFGSTAKSFYSPEYGEIIIDLAQIEDFRIYDLRQYLLRKEAPMGPDEIDLEFKYPGDDADPEVMQKFQTMAAARDVYRTREVLILGNIPRAAIVAHRIKDEAFRPFGSAPPLQPKLIAMIDDVNRKYQAAIEAKQTQSAKTDSVSTATASS